jgi:hypothetical protein
MAAVQRMNMRNILLGLSVSITLAACGGGGGAGGSAAASSNAQVASAPAPAPAPAPAASPAPSVSSGDLSLADRLYKGDARTPDGFSVEARPASVAGTLSTRHLKNGDIATGPQAQSTSFEVCTNDMAQALDWSERQANWNGQYSDMTEVRSDARMWEVIRTPRADVTAMLRHRVFRCDYLDRSSSDLRAEQGSAGLMNQRPLNATELKALSEYLWQFTMFNNSDYAVQSSTGASSGSSITHTIRMGQLVRGANGACDTVQVTDWVHTMDTTNGSLSKALAAVRSYKVKSTFSGVES